MSTVIKLKEISTPGLLRLMRDVAAEIESRLKTGPVEVREKAPSPKGARVAQVLRTPADEDRDFVLMVAGMVRRGDYIKAEERQRVAQIAEEFGPWVKHQGLPIAPGATAWKRAGEAIRAPRARER